MDTFDDYIKRLSNDIFDMKVRIADKLAKDVVEGVRTPDWAKNMLAGIPEQLSRAEYEILEEILKEKNRFMEEKKTKKMTKAEAFEYLKGKKVRVSCRGINESVQSKLFTCGVQWMGGGTGFCDYGNYYVIDSHGLLGHCDGTYWERLINEEISADDILSIEIIEEKHESEFNYDKAVELAKPLMHYLSETGHTEVISVCMEGISAIPMGTFLYKG